MNVYHQIVVVLLFLLAVGFTATTRGTLPTIVYYSAIMLLVFAGIALVRAFVHPTAVSVLVSAATSITLLVFAGAVRYTNSMYTS